VRRWYPLLQSQAGGPPLVSCSQLIEYIHSYLPIWSLSPPYVTWAFAIPFWQKATQDGRGTRCTISKFHSVE
jgi:hypothetical protein